MGEVQHTGAVTATRLVRTTAGLGLAVVVLALSAAAPPRHETGPVATEAYRHVPPLAGATAPAATARVSLQFTAGRTTQGLIVRSAERVPQVSLFVPPAAFSVGAGSGTVVVEAAPVEPTGELVTGTRVSNVYVVRARSAAGPVTLQKAVQPLAITLRGFETGTVTVTAFYRPAAGGSWRALDTTVLGHHLYGASAPGLGEFVLGASPASTVAPPASKDDGWPLGWVALALGVLVSLVLVGRAVAHRLSSSRQGGLA